MVSDAYTTVKIYCISFHPKVRLTTRSKQHLCEQFNSLMTLTCGTAILQCDSTLVIIIFRVLSLSFPPMIVTAVFTLTIQYDIVSTQRLSTQSTPISRVALWCRLQWVADQPTDLSYGILICITRASHAESLEITIASSHSHRTRSNVIS